MLATIEEKKIDSKQLPEGWEWKKLGAIASLIRGVSYDKANVFNQPRKDLIGIFRATNIQQRIENTDLVYVPRTLVKGDQVVRDGDILVAMSSGSKDLVGKTAQAFQNYDAAFGTFCGLIRVTSSSVSNRYLGYFFRTKAYRNYVSAISKGVNINNLKRDHLETIPIPLPPLVEQHAIVEKIEAMFSELDHAIAQLQTAKQQLHTYRQSVLKYAFEGFYTGGMDGWKEVKLGEVAEYITSGSRGWAKYYSESGAIFLRITNLDFNSIKLDLVPDKIQHVKLNGVSEGLRTQVQSGDVLISITGYLGMTAVVKNIDADAYVNQHICLVRLKQVAVPEFIAYFLSADTGGLKQFQVVGKGATKAGLTLGDVRNVELSLPSIEHQQQIVSEIETRLSESDHLLTTINNQLTQSEALRQSILQRAFEGRLTEVVRKSAQVIPLTQQSDQLYLRKVFAAYIISLCGNSDRFGITKFQKTLHVSEYHCQADFGSDYAQKMAGPLDHKFIYPFIEEGQEKDWFRVYEKNGTKFFEIGSNIHELVLEYPKHLRSYSQPLKKVINLLKDKNLREAELISTIYAVWNNFLIRNYNFSDRDLISGILDWSEEKAKYDELEIIAMKKWMQKEGLVPCGWGKEILKKK